jgi:Mg2+ and Co2+ transporter CorA
MSEEERVMQARLDAFSDRLSKIEKKEDEAMEVRVAVLSMMQKLEMRLETLSTVIDKLPDLIKSLAELSFQVKDLQNRTADQTQENIRRKNETFQLQIVVVGVFLTAILGFGSAVLLKEPTVKSVVVSPVK